MNNDLKDKILLKIKDFVLDVSEHNKALTFDGSLRFADAKMDEFDLIELIMTLEEQFETIIVDTEFTPASCVSSLVDHILVSTERL
jgi:acyl carrier protein